MSIQFDELIRTGQVASYPELARLGHVTPARVTHIMTPEIQERWLFLPRVESGKEAVCLKNLQRVAREWKWERQ